MSTPSIDGIVEIHDLGVAAYLRTRGLRCSGVKGADVKRGTGTFVFRGSVDEINAAIVDYQDSAERRFDEALRYLKTLARVETRRL